MLSTMKVQNIWTVLPREKRHQFAVSIQSQIYSNIATRHVQCPL